MIDNDMNFVPFNNNTNNSRNRVISGWIPITIYKAEEFSQNTNMNNLIPNENNIPNIQEGLFQYNNNGNSTYDTINALREFDLDLDEDTDLVRVNNNDIDKIFNDIEKNYPGTFALLRSYNVPYPIAKLLIRRTIKLSLTYCKKREEE